MLLYTPQNSQLTLSDKDINFPYMAVVDYLGYRLIAMTRLPISSRTLKVGTQDATSSIFRHDEEGMKIIRSLGKQLNLAPHRIYDRNFGDDTTPLPPDTELHVGEDGRMYARKPPKYLPN